MYLYFGGLYIGALDLTKQLQSFNTDFLNLNWTVVSDKMFCIYHFLYKKEANIYISER